MITKARISNFRVIGDISANLGRLNLIVGPNGCGKSTFLDFFTKALPGMGAAFKRPAQMTKFIMEAIDNSGGSCVSVVDDRPIIPTPINSMINNSLLAWPKIILPLHFEMSKLRMSNHSSNNAETLDPDGSNLTRIIAEYRLSNQSNLDKLRQQLSKVVPSIRDVKIRLNNGNFELLMDTIAATDIPTSFISDGTLFTLGLLTALNQVEGSHALLLVDDIDQGLHPLAQKELVGLLQGILENNPDLQIIATTHSPYLLACMQPQEVLCMHLGEDGLSRMAPLTDHPDFERWKDEMNPGEFWSLFGDEWVAKKAQA